MAEINCTCPTGTPKHQLNCPVVTLVDSPPVSTDEPPTLGEQAIHGPWRAAFHYRSECKPASEPSLQLLVIEAYDQCFVVAERGDIPEIYNTGYVGNGQSKIFDCGFPELKEKFDALADGDKPVPRIERMDAANGWYCLYYTGDGARPLSVPAYDALCRVAGVTIPVYEPKRGVWKQLLPFTLNDMYTGGDITSASQMDGGTGIKAYRYTMTTEGE